MAGSESSNKNLEIDSRLQTNAGFQDLRDTEEIYALTGEGRVEFLNQYNSQDIQNLPDHAVTLGAFLTQKGKIVSDSVILKLPEKILLIFQKGYGEKVLQHLDIYLNFAEVELKEAPFSHFILLGPQASLGPLAKLPPPTTDFSFHQLSFQDHPLWAFSTDRFGMAGWEVLLPCEAAVHFTNTLEQAGALALDSETLEILRVEAGLPKLGVDMGEDNLVAEVGLDKRAVSFNKGCYLGQETTARVESRGHVNKKLTQLSLEKLPTDPLPWDVFHQGQKVGQITSAVLSPKFQKALALGILKVLAEEELEIRTNSETVKAKNARYA